MATVQLPRPETPGPVKPGPIPVHGVHEKMNKKAGMIGMLVFGVVLIIGGLSGGLVFRGTNSGVLLALVGAVITVLGVVRLMRTKASS